MHISRRSVLRGGLGTALVGTTPFGGILGSTPASAAVIVAVAIAVACVVASRIAAHNTRPVNIYLLRAINAKIDTALANQSLLLEATAEILNQLASLPEKIDELLRRQSVRDIHRRLAAYAELYASEARQLDSFKGNERRWLQEGTRKERLAKLHYDVRIAIAELRKSDYPIDPAAAMVAPLALSTELALADRLGETKLAKGAIADYKPWLKAMIDDGSGSISSYRKAAQAEADRSRAAIGALVGRLLDGNSATLACAQIIDQIPATTKAVIVNSPHARGDMVGMRIRRQPVPAVYRDTELFWIDLALEITDIEVAQRVGEDVKRELIRARLSTEEKSGVKWISLKSDQPRVSRETLSGRKDFSKRTEILCFMASRDAPKPEQRLAAVEGIPQWQERLGAHSILKAQLLALNAANGRVTFANAAEKVIQTNLQVLDKIEALYT
jgi:hypothetical protein